MWERSARQNPLSARYQFYRDNRPVLPQDKTWDRFVNRHQVSKLYYFLVKYGNKSKYLCSNNMPVHDRLTLQSMVEFRSYFHNVLKWAGVVPTVLMSAWLFKRVTLSKKIFYPLIFFAIFQINNVSINGYFDYLFYHNFSYYYHKYSHMTVENLAEVNDPSKKHFKLDTDVYYRQTAHELSGHHGDDEGHGDHHDTSTYYGPYPVRIYNLVQ